MVWQRSVKASYGMAEVCGGCLAAEASRSITFEARDAKSIQLTHTTDAALCSHPNHTPHL